MKQKNKILFQLFAFFYIILVVGCPSPDDEITPIEENDTINLKVEELSNLSSQDLFVTNEYSIVESSKNGGFVIQESDVFMAVKKDNLDKIVYIGLYSNQNSIFREDGDYILGTEETALYLILYSLPIDSYYDLTLSELEEIKAFLLKNPGVQNFIGDVKDNIEEYGYLLLESLQIELQNVIGDLNNCLGIVGANFLPVENPNPVKGNSTPNVSGTPYFIQNQGNGIKLIVDGGEIDNNTLNWRVALKAVNANPLFLGLTVGHKNPITGEVSYEPNEIDYLIAPYNTSDFLNVFTTCEGLNKYFTDIQNIFSEDGWEYILNDNTQFDKTFVEGIEIELKDENDVVVIVPPKNSPRVALANLIQLNSDVLDIVFSGINIRNHKPNQTIKLCQNKKLEYATKFIDKLLNKPEFIDKLIHLDTDLKGFKEVSKLLIQEAIIFLGDQTNEALFEATLCKGTESYLPLLTPLLFIEHLSRRLALHQFLVGLGETGGNLIQLQYSWKQLNHFYLEMVADFEKQDLVSIEWEDEPLHGNHVMTKTSDGNFVSIGLVAQSNNYHDLLVKKMNGEGEIVWEKSYGGSFSEEGRKLIETKDGGFIIAGNSFSNDGDIPENKGENDFWVLKLDINGNLEWSKTFGGSNFDAAISIQQTSSGEYLVAGNTKSNDGNISNLINNGWNSTDIWIVKLNSHGQLIWENSIGGFNSEEVNEIIETSDGKYLLVGWTTSSDGDVSNLYSIDKSDGWIVKLTANGEIEWEKNYGGTGYDVVKSVVQIDNNNFIFVGQSTSNDNDNSSYIGGGGDFWVVEIDNFGSIIRETSYGGTDRENPAGIVNHNVNEYIIYGTSESSNGNISNPIGEDDMWVIKINGNDLIWEKSIGGPEVDFIHSVVSINNCLYVSGSSENNGSYNNVLIKLRENN